jgi:hypothetical protein
MAAMKFFALIALLAVANAARMPDLQLVEEDLPESVVAFQSSGGVQAHHSDDNTLDLGEWSQMEAVGHLQPRSSCKL